MKIFKHYTKIEQGDYILKKIPKLTRISFKNMQKVNDYAIDFIVNLKRNLSNHHSKVKLWFAAKCSSYGFDSKFGHQIRRTSH